MYHLVENDGTLFLIKRQDVGGMFFVVAEFFGSADDIRDVASEVVNVLNLKHSLAPPLPVQKPTPAKQYQPGDLLKNAGQSIKGWDDPVVQPGDPGYGGNT